MRPCETLGSRIRVPAVFVQRAVLVMCGLFVSGTYPAHAAVMVVVEALYGWWQLSGKKSIRIHGVTLCLHVMSRKVVAVVEAAVCETGAGLSAHAMVHIGSHAVAVGA